MTSLNSLLVRWSALPKIKPVIAVISGNAVRSTLRIKIQVNKNLSSKSLCLKQAMIPRGIKIPKMPN